MEAIQNLINPIIATNPWGCTSYVENGATIAGFIRKNEYYSGTERTMSLRSNAIVSPSHHMNQTAFSPLSKHGLMVFPISHNLFSATHTYTLSIPEIKNKLSRVLPSFSPI